MSQHRGLRRSSHLFRSFLVEQTDPDRFYGDLAARAAEAFRARGARYVAVDHDPTVASVADGGVTGSALALPVADAAADIVFSSNLLEHVPEFTAVADELVRVTRPGGVLYLSYTNWWSPWGAHEASPWHWLGADYAVRRYQKRHGRRPKNLLGETLYRVSIAEGLAWAGSRDDVEVLAARPRYLPDVARHLLAVPGLREVATWNLLLILRRRDDSTLRPAPGGDS